MRTCWLRALAGCSALSALATAAQAQVALSRARTSSPPAGSLAPAEPRPLPSRLEWVRSRPPIGFQPFDTLDARGRRLPLDSVITLRFPSGHASRPMTLRDLHYFVNQLERTFNAHGASLRRLDTSTVLLRPRVDAALLRRQHQLLDATPRLTRPVGLPSAVERMQRLEPRSVAPLAQLAQADPQMARMAATAGPMRARPPAARGPSRSPMADAQVDRFVETTGSTMVVDTTWRWDAAYGDFGASANVGAGVTLVSSFDAASIAFSYTAGASFLGAAAPLLTLDVEFLAPREGPATATVVWSLLGNLPERVDGLIAPRTMGSRGMTGPPEFYWSEGMEPLTSAFTLDVPLLPVSVDLELSVDAGFDVYMSTTTGQPALSGYVAPQATARVDATLNVSLDFPPVEIGAEGYLTLIATSLYAALENVVRTSGSDCAAGALCNRFDYGAFRAIDVGAGLRALQGAITFYLDVPVPCAELPPWCWTRVATLGYSWEPLNWNRDPLFRLSDVATVAEDVELEALPRMRSSPGQVMTPAPRP